IFKNIQQFYRSNSYETLKSAFQRTVADQIPLTAIPLPYKFNQFQLDANNDQTNFESAIPTTNFTRQYEVNWNVSSSDKPIVNMEYSTAIPSLHADARAFTDITSYKTKIVLGLVRPEIAEYIQQWPQEFLLYVPENMKCNNNHQDLEIYHVQCY